VTRAASQARPHFPIGRASFISRCCQSGRAAQPECRSVSPRSALDKSAVRRLGMIRSRSGSLLPCRGKLPQRERWSRSQPGNEGRMKAPSRCVSGTSPVAQRTRRPGGALRWRVHIEVDLEAFSAGRAVAAHATRSSLFCKGRTRRHLSPLGSNSTCSCPPSSRVTACSMSRVPKPLA
jgi:hypothetical protein